MGHQPSLVLAFVSILLLSIKPLEASRSVPRDDEQVWMRKKHLLLPSLQSNSITPPGPNPGTNNVVNSALGEKNFAASKKPGSLKKHLLLPSLWNPVTSPTPNPGTNSALAGEKNFAAGLPQRKKSSHLLLPALQWRPVKPPSTNPGHNSVGTVSEQNFAGGKVITHPPSSSRHHKQHHKQQLPLSRKATS